MKVTRLVPDDLAAIRRLTATGQHVPPMSRGFLCVDRATGETCGAIAVTNFDGQDATILADGGWSVHGAPDLFRYLFDQLGLERISAQCKAANVRNLRVLQRLGFVIEGRKRLSDGDVINLGMLRTECRLLGRAA